jgi:hypothetical protein
MVRPGDGTRAIHYCAAMMGIPLETDLPNNVLLVYGMRKTSDINQGRSHLIDAFKQFGDIETAGINPKNKGFGELSICFFKTTRLSISTKCTFC